MPSLEQYAYAMLSRGQQVPIQVLRSVITKRTVRKPTNKKLLEKTQMVMSAPSPGSPPKKKELLDFITELKTLLRIYLETQPVVPINILSNIYNLFEHGLLDSNKLRAFKQSSQPVSVLDNYIGGRENVCLLLKHSRKIYLIILQQQYMDFYRHVPEEEFQKFQQRNQQGKAAIEAFVRYPPKKINVRYAVPIGVSQTDITPPLPFQQQTTMRLSTHV